MTQTRLDSLQTDFVAALFDTRLAANIASAWSGGDRVVERLALHRENLFAAWEKSLGNAFPVIHAIIGAEFFSSLARDYGHAHPSTCGDLNRFGDKFAKFIGDHERAQSLPYLGDVAALEWSIHRAYFAADVSPLSPAHLAALSPDDLLATRFSLQPACAWVSSMYPIASIWLGHQQRSPSGLPNTSDQKEHALVYRSNWQTHVITSSTSEIAALAQLRAGENMETAIRSALNAEPGYDLARALVRWLDLSLLGEHEYARPT